MLTYAALVWWKITHLTTVKKLFGHIQRIACFGMTEIYHFCKLWLKKRLGKLHTDCTAPTILKNLSPIFKMATEYFPVLMAPPDSMLPLEVFDRKYLVEYPSRELWQQKLQHDFLPMA
jgi:hypothetical protein